MVKSTENVIEFSPRRSRQYAKLTVFSKCWCFWTQGAGTDKIEKQENVALVRQRAIKSQQIFNNFEGVKLSLK